MHWGSLCQDHLSRFWWMMFPGLSYPKQILTEEEKPAKLHRNQAHKDVLFFANMGRAVRVKTRQVA